MANRGRPIITDDHQVLKQRMRAERDGERKRRLQMLVLFSSEHPPTRGEVAEHLGVDPKTITRWLDNYASGGIERLLVDQPPGARPGQHLLPAPVFEALKRRLNDQQGVAGYAALQQWISEEFGLEVNYTSLHGLVRYRLKAKLKVPRPEHPKKV